jgi:hypothetical protein
MISRMMMMISVPMPMYMFVVVPSDAPDQARATAAILSGRTGA